MAKYNNLVADSSIDCGLKENDTGVNTNKNKTLTSITRVSKKNGKLPYTGTCNNIECEQRYTFLHMVISGLKA